MFPMRHQAVDTLVANFLVTRMRVRPRSFASWEHWIRDTSAPTRPILFGPSVWQAPAEAVFPCWLSSDWLHVATAKKLFRDSYVARLSAAMSIDR